jgi:sortase A
LVLLGAVVAAYPVAATFYNNQLLADRAGQYSSQVLAANPQTLQDALTRARAYNATLGSVPIGDPWTGTDPTLTTSYQSYLHQLDQFDAMARVKIPAIKVDLPIYHGTSEDALAHGVGHLYGSALPVGGSGTHAVLTGHSSLASATLFEHVSDLRLGDVFTIEVYGETLAYRVDHIATVLPDQTDGLRAVEGHDYVTLITCTPKKVNSHRLLVRAERIPLEEAKAVSGTGSSAAVFKIEGWMVPRLVGAALALLIAVILCVRWALASRRLRAKRRMAAGAARGTTTRSDREEAR